MFENSNKEKVIVTTMKCNPYQRTWAVHCFQVVLCMAWIKIVYLYWLYMLFKTFGQSPNQHKQSETSLTTRLVWPLTLYLSSALVGPLEAAGVLFPFDFPGLSVMSLMCLKVWGTTTEYNTIVIRYLQASSQYMVS